MSKIQKSATIERIVQTSLFLSKEDGQKYSLIFS